MMHKYLIATAAAATAAFSIGAQAADLPRRTMAPEPVPVYSLPVFTWSGFYVGLNAGGGFSANNGNGGNTYFLPAGSIVGSAGTNGVLTLPNNGNNNRSGFVGGVQLGYNWQAGSFVYGLETDIQYANLSRRNGQVTPFPGYTFVGAPGVAFAPPPATVVTGFGNGSGQNYFGTVRGRMGFAFDRTLIYGTAGLAYGGNNSRVGYAAGGGVEYAFSNNWTAKFEALYVSLGRNNNNGAGGVYNGGTNILTLANNASRRNDFVVVRAGLNYRFGSTSAGPVFAKY
jgi:outer membrane immunogenic protein